MLKDKLTIILLIKGRPKFTQRWLTYANKYLKDLKIIVADGSEIKERYKISKESFPNIDLVLPEFPYDDKIETFQKKIQNSIDLTKTEYLCMMSNDDFILKESLDKIIKFLDENKDYSCGRGDVYDFSINNIDQKQSIYGDIYSINKLFHSIGFKKQDVVLRLKEFGNCPHGLWHCIVRKNIFKKAIQESLINKINNPQIFENFITYYLVISGKVYFNKSLYLLHQKHKEMQTVGKNFESFYSAIKKNISAYENFINILIQLILVKNNLKNINEIKNIFNNILSKRRTKVELNKIESFFKNIRLLIFNTLINHNHILFLLIKLKTKIAPYNGVYKREINLIKTFLDYK